MRIYFSLKITAVGIVLVALMLRASWWQWERYQEKQAFIQTLAARLAEPIVPLESLLTKPSADWDAYTHRRVQVRGVFDFEHEMALRNRRYGETAGMHALTPLRLETGSGESHFVLVNRGFIPISRTSRDARREFQSQASIEFVGLIKASSRRAFLAPADPPAGRDLPWVDHWLRVDIPSIARQLPYSILPIYLEIMSTQDKEAVEESMLASSSGKDELLFLGARATQVSHVGMEPNLPYPLPVFDTVIPPGRHFGYIFEWAGMAIMTALICFILQLRPPRTTI